MERILSATSKRSNPQIAPTARDFFGEIDVLASIDTLVLFAARWPKGTLAKVNELQCGLQPSWFAPCENKDGYCWGFILTVQQPRHPTLLFLAGIQKQHLTKSVRLDVAYDFIGRDEEHKRAITAWLRGRILLLHRRAAFLHEDEQTVSWITQRDRKRRSNKDLVLYDDRPCKLDGQVDCSHLEIRLYDARIIQRLGLGDIGDIVDLKPHELFALTIKLTAFNVEEYVKRRIQKSYRGDLMRNHIKFAERWNTNVHRRLQTLANKIFQHSAQRAKDILGDKRVYRHMINVDNLRIPHELSWPLPSSLSLKSSSSMPSHRPRYGR